MVNGPDAGTAAPTPIEVPSNASGWIVRDLPGSPREVVLGPRRFRESSAGAIAVAVERFEGNIVAAVPVAAGWVFIDDRGTVARSESFVAMVASRELRPRLAGARTSYTGRSVTWS